jgi:hypothetical protein
MAMQSKPLVSPAIQDIVHLIFECVEDQTVQRMLVEALLAEGLSDTVSGQILAYAVEGMRRTEEEIAKISAIVNSGTEQTTTPEA